MFAFHVEDLSADHAGGSGRCGEFFNERGDGVGARIGGEDFERERDHGIAGEDGDRFAEDFVVGRPATAQIVIVHRGEIVVDEGESVDQLDRDGSCENGGVNGVAAAGGGGFEDERGAKPLTAGVDAVGDGLFEAWRDFAGSVDRVCQRASERGAVSAENVGGVWKILVRRPAHNGRTLLDVSGRGRDGKGGGHSKAAQVVRICGLVSRRIS